MTKLLTRDDVIKILDMKDTIGILEKAFHDLATEKAVMPQRIPLLPQIIVDWHCSCQHT